MSYFQEWGFQSDPFATDPLPASQFGRTLLVGRDRELRRLVGALRATSRIITLEGATGVGKTSLANVGAWVCYDQHTSEGIGPLFIPCNRLFQLRDDPNFDLDEFVFGVLMAVAQTLISRRIELEDVGRKSSGLGSLARWLNSSRVSGWQASVGVGGVTVGFGKNLEAGEIKAGFRDEILTELTEIFPLDGGVVCIIDNLELLQTSAKARAMLEDLRDELLHVPGIRWILAGAGGIVESVVSTPRLDGYLSDPILIRGIDDRYAGEILRSRRDAYSLTSGQEAYLPITIDCFTHLYHLLAGNIRSTLGRASSYCESCAMEEAEPEATEAKEVLYLEWLDRHSRRLLGAVDKEIKPRAWEIFDVALTELAGQFDPGDYARFGCKSANVLSPHLRTLELCGVVASFRGESDKRRKTIQVTPKGRLVHYARQDPATRLSPSDVRSLSATP